MIPDQPTDRPSYSHCPILEMLSHLKMLLKCSPYVDIDLFSPYFNLILDNGERVGGQMTLTL